MENTAPSVDNLDLRKASILSTDSYSEEKPDSLSDNLKKREVCYEMPTCRDFIKSLCTNKELLG